MKLIMKSTSILYNIKIDAQNRSYIILDKYINYNNL